MLERVSTPTPGLLLIVQQKIVTQRGSALPQVQKETLEVVNRRLLQFKFELKQPAIYDLQ